MDGPLIGQVVLSTESENDPLTVTGLLFEAFWMREIVPKVPVGFRFEIDPMILEGAVQPKSLHGF